jgi:hypothetical protein
MATQLYPSWSLHSWFDKNDARYEATFMLTVWEYYYDYYQGKTNPSANKITAVYPRVWDDAKMVEMFNDYLKLTEKEGVSEVNGEFKDVTMQESDGKTMRAGVQEFIQKWCPGFNNTTPTDIKPTVSNGVSYLRVYPFIKHPNKTDKENEKYWRSGYISDYCQPVIKKFDMDHIETWNTRQSYRDVVLANLSETMLLAAEACIGQNNFSQAETYIQKVLDRPGNKKDPSAPLTITLPANQQDALEVYLKESGKELAGQYCGRWPELRRTKMLEYMFKKYNYDVVDRNLGDSPIGQKTYRPIPQDAIDLNDGLTDADQNPGY